MMIRQKLLHNTQFKVKAPITLFSKPKLPFDRIYYPDVCMGICYQLSFCEGAASNIRDFLFVCFSTTKPDT